MQVSFGSRIGFLLALVGSAIGLGNIWKFPYLAGQNGGGVFVLFYLLCVFFVAIPLLIAEISMGKSTCKPGQLGIPQLTGKPWTKFLGWVPLITSFFVMSFYSVVSGWVLCYLVQSILVIFGKDVNLVGYFNNLLLNFWELTAYHLVFMLFNMWILWRNVRKGIERFCVWMMPLLGVIIIALLGFAIFEGDILGSLAFMFEPRLHEFHPDAIKTALGHAFFSVGIGFGIALTYGAYLKKGEPTAQDCLWVGLSDTAIALLMGIIIFSFTTQFGVKPSAGPTLIFDTLPGIFALMPFGKFVSVIFYFGVFIACVTSSISILEVMVFSLNGEAGESKRHNSVLKAGSAAFLLGIVSVLSFNHWSEWTWWRGTAFDNLDFFSSNILLPLFGFTVTVVFVRYLYEGKLLESFVPSERHLLPGLRWVLKWISLPVMLIVFFTLIFF
jgi:neurotransmitter:Na+ symporter, NSS family